ncbi:MAG: diacylglycerol kinase family lipid kinase [Paludibacter sp.]|jgi:diacylglycerol kinase (ATP)|nr:diacylglycerol kinase family lipid kinase [Paludibacter sp.]
MSTQNWGIIINPKSGKKKFRRQRRLLFKTLRNNNITFDYRITQFVGHASEIARYYVENGYKNILVLGGDGTVSETVNGIFSAKIDNTADLTLALIPRGTGNDWARFWGLTRDGKKSLEVFLRGKTQIIDIGKIDYSIEKKQFSHFFINSIGFGLDAKVVDVTHKLKNFFGSHSFLYFIALLTAVFTYRSHKLSITSHEKTFRSRMFTMNIANGCYSGGGLKQNPNAVPTDGLLDVMLASVPTFWDIITAITALVRGKFLEHHIISSFRTQKLQIICDRKAQIEADGILINGFNPFTISILPNAIKMLVP